MVCSCALALIVDTFCCGCLYSGWEVLRSGDGVLSPSSHLGWFLWFHSARTLFSSQLKRLILKERRSVMLPSVLSHSLEGRSLDFSLNPTSLPSESVHSKGSSSCKLKLFGIFTRSQPVRVFALCSRERNAIPVSSFPNVRMMLSFHKGSTRSAGRSNKLKYLCRKKIINKH